MKVMDCLQKRVPIPDELWVYPFKLLPNGDCVTNQEYRDAPYELTLLDKDGKTWRVLG